MKLRQPEDVGISQNQISHFIEQCESEIRYLHGFIVAKDGYLISKTYWTPERGEILRNGYSLGKSLVSLAIGFLIDEGTIDFGTEVIPLFKDELPPVYDVRLEHLTIRNLLTMAASSAVASTEFNGIPSDKWLNHYFSLIPYTDPGKEFHYDTGGMYLLSCIVSKITGKNTLDYLKPRLFKPLGIENYKWLEDANGRNVGGWGIYLTPEDSIKIAQTLASEGKWCSKQIIPEWYVKALSKKQIDTYDYPHIGWKYGYSYGFWKGKEDIFAAFGAFGQLWVCSPKRNMAVVTFAGCSHSENQRLFDIIQDTLILPVNNNQCIDKTLSNNLNYTEKKLQIPVPLGNNKPNSETVYGKYLMQPNEKYQEVIIDNINNSQIFVCLNSQDQHIGFMASFGKWSTSQALKNKDACSISSFSYAWENNKLIIKECQLNQPSIKTLVFSFHDDSICMNEEIFPSLTTNDATSIIGFKS